MFPPSDDDSVFNYLFPEGAKSETKSLKSKKALVGKNEFSEKVYNLKKEAKKKSLANLSIKSGKSNKSNNRSVTSAKSSKSPVRSA